MRRDKIRRGKKEWREFEAMKQRERDETVRRFMDDKNIQRGGGENGL